ncbi:hypothetical protein H6F76_16695 [Leptolyngbya sp. FACHB-321]|uniref:hypothetical protein n=1 Tax=Leptolyngbya sp. FACHB-321 TaxID=2692807 RepID=UPI0016899C90|nr:hypothetical protein [Leptolyngbya sp. FACHB-321]MBD2036651.1 hypothetical protein [Leptolyngbya sp. FACHB-321]
MGEALRRLKDCKQARAKINSLMDSAETTLVIHYSCESFYERTDGRTPRITSIAVRNLASGQTESFSIHKIAEQKNVPFNQIDANYDELEKETLDEFFDFVRSHQQSSWVHWNMRDINYGFAAIEHRYSVLNGNPFSIFESKKFDLARALVAIYGREYIGHPRLEALVDKNSINKRDSLTGKEEAEAFSNRAYIKLHQSTLRKVDIIANVFSCACYQTLQTDATWFSQYGSTPRVAVELIKENWLWSAVGITLTAKTFIARLSGWFS